MLIIIIIICNKIVRKPAVRAIRASTDLDEISSGCLGTTRGRPNVT
jgi:hypothetical protein